MGNYLDLPLATLSELQRETAVHLTYKGKLGGSAFLRTLLCLHSEHGTVVVKVRCEVRTGALRALLHAVPACGEYARRVLSRALVDS